MTLAGIELRYLITEMNKQVKDYYVSNIYGVSRNSILFKLHHAEKPDLLIMFSTFGLWITGIKINQMEENRLIKRLRNDLLRSKITEIKQLGSSKRKYRRDQNKFYSSCKVDRKNTWTARKICRRNNQDEQVGSKQVGKYII